MGEKKKFKFVWDINKFVYIAKYEFQHFRSSKIVALKLIRHHLKIVVFSNNKNIFSCHLKKPVFAHVS